ncbi:hypothetical protein CLV62_10278 [Dysgonomonas alginatilytica]|uniref:SprB-like repeat protein n=1 Tax=Dysgonomonas alginatilytica TaxID=1605892 RepID=A0A2V3PVC9_9BACT|nr:hypothetical protein [Dysgonomonas alginatilytica]PXV68048.1 hypothetical protein CLV62_10278 [Dysgonomonas alginatilytica]
MKKLLYLFLSFTLFISNIYAQDCNDVTASATVIPSTCQSNGTITITFAGASADKLVNKQYSLKSTTGSLSVGPVSTNVFTNLPPGTYNLEAAGFCNTLTGPSIVRTVNNVVVTGSYQEPRLSFVAPAATSTAAIPTSRNSYQNCTTGLVVVLLENGNQTSMPTFTITSAPAGVTVPQVVSAVKATSGSAAAGWRYTLGDTWPAGTYTVSVNDGCYTSVTSFIIKELTAVPTGTASYTYFAPYNPGVPDCSKVYYRPYYYYNSIDYPDFYRYYSDGLYEYGIAPLNGTPKDWFRIRYFSGNSSTYQDLIDLGPGKYSDYYSSGSPTNLTLYTRVKDCPSAITSIGLYLKIPAFSVSASDNNCAGIRTYTVNKYTDYDGVLCYPLTVTITDRSTGEVVYNNTNYMSTDPAITWVCNTGESFYRNITDANGYKLQTNYSLTGIAATDTPTPSLSTFNNYSSDRYCDYYDRPYSSSYPCDNGYPNPVYVTVTDDTGAVIQRDTLMSTVVKYARNLQYDKQYTLTFVYPNSNNLTKTLVSKTSSYIPTAFTLTKYSTSVCADNRGYLRVSATSPLGTGYMRKGDTVIITGPDGYVSQSYTKTSDGSSTDYYYSFPETYLPPGDYTATIVSCGKPYTVTTAIQGGYTGDKLGYNLERDCISTKLFPSGSISLNGNPVSTVYFRMTQVPSGSGANSMVIPSTSKESFSLTIAGTYILGMMTSNSLTGCAIKSDTIVYNPQPLALDKDKTSAYSCPSGETGYLTLQATNGVAPYTYTIYDETNTIRLTDPMTSEHEIDLGNFGVANETYTVRISDACGNSFPQQVTLVSLDRTALAYGQTPVCYGSPISLNGFTVTNATYNWTGPNGFTSTEKNPVIPNASSKEEGLYIVEITSTTCGVTVKDTIDISVYDPVSVADLHGKMQEATFCAYQAIMLGQAATGGSGNFTYQWAYNSSNLGTGVWYDIAGETNPIFKSASTTYMFTSTQANPTRRYMRLTITDATCGPYVLYYHTNARGCMFLANPDLRSPGTETTGN